MIELGQLNGVVKSLGVVVIYSSVLLLDHRIIIRSFDSDMGKENYCCLLENLVTVIDAFFTGIRWGSHPVMLPLEYISSDILRMIHYGASAQIDTENE